jgi:hypothetical protein
MDVTTHLRETLEHIEKPSTELIDKYIKLFNNNLRYKPADDAINKLFSAFPNNKEVEEILLKISVINDLYSTNILATFKMAEHIQKLDIDGMLRVGNLDVVNQIATGHDIRRTKTKTELNLYSFATKYCNWHNQESYAIYDSFVEKILLAFNRKFKFCDFKQTDLKDFRKFKRILDEFIKHFDLQKHSLKEIDKFLWIYGKEKFPPSYARLNTQNNENNIN